ncbi:hypothetical protein NN561_011592 [Cricetulus griseus]
MLRGFGLGGSSSPSGSPGRLHGLVQLLEPRPPPGWAASYLPGSQPTWPGGLDNQGRGGRFLRPPPDQVSGDFFGKKLELRPTSTKSLGLKLVLKRKGENT